jgi:hypothetical protein
MIMESTADEGGDTAEHHEDQDVPADDLVAAAAASVPRLTYPCCGYYPIGVPYPFYEHINLSELGSAGIDFCSSHLKSKECEALVSTSGGSCNKCSDLKHHPRLQRIVERGTTLLLATTYRNCDMSRQQLLRKVQQCARIVGCGSTTCLCTLHQHTRGFLCPLMLWCLSASARKFWH